MGKGIPLVQEMLDVVGGHNQEFKMIVEYEGLNQEQFDVRYKRKTSKSRSWKQSLRKLLPTRASTFAFEKFPVLNLAKSYKCRDYFLNDLFSGLSVALMAIPQSFGYARIANIPEILGLYTSFFPVIIYFIFTTSTHVSLGTMALASLLIGSAINNLKLPAEAHFEANSSLLYMLSVDNVSSDISLEHRFNENDEIKILMTVSLSCASGLILLIMSFLKMGFLVSFMSDAFVSGFLAASNLRVLVIEIKDIFGIHPQLKHSGFCEFFLNAYEVFFELKGINLVQVGMSAIALVILLSVKEFINKRYKDKLKVPIPVEIIIVIVSIALMKLLRLESKFNVEVSGGMRSGIPSLMVPSFKLMYNNVTTAFPLAMICFMMVGMMAKLFSQSHGYQVDDNQEMFAMGLAGVFGSFFCSMAPSTSPPRCFLAESAGAKTQLTHLFSAIFALLSMLAFAPLLRDLPVCILACIIIVACLPLFPHFIKFYPYWKSNKYEFSVWCVTFAMVLIFSVEIGMLVGMSYSLLVVHIWVKKHPQSFILEKTSNNLFLPPDLYSFESRGMNEFLGMEEAIAAEEKIVIFRFESPLYFATLENFKESLFSKVPSYYQLGRLEFGHVKQEGCLSCMYKEESTQTFCRDESSKIEKDTSISIVLTPDIEAISEQKCKHSFHKELNGRTLKVIIVDCSNINFCDSSGAELLAHMNLKYLSVGVDLHLASCNKSVINQLRRVSICCDLYQNHLYPSVQDAYIASIKSFINPLTRPIDSPTEL